MSREPTSYSAPLKLLPYGATQICLLLLFSSFLATFSSIFHSLGATHLT